MTDGKTPTLDPGVHTNIDDETYFALPYVSKSKLWRLHAMPTSIQTCEQAQAWIDMPLREDMYALRLGRAFDDAMMLGAGNWRAKWNKGPVNEKTGKGYGGETKKFIEAAEGNPNTLIPEDMDTIDHMVRSVMLDPDARAMIGNPSAMHQVVIVWDDDVTGVRCKAKVDMWTSYQKRSTHVDWKTWTKKRPECDSDLAFGWEIENRGYNVQAAHYLHGCTCLDELNQQPHGDRDFVFVAVNKASIELPNANPVHEIGIYRLTIDDLEASLRVRDELLRKYIDIQNGTWQPERRGVKEVRLSRRLENDYEY